MTEKPHIYCYRIPTATQIISVLDALVTAVTLLISLYSTKSWIFVVHFVKWQTVSDCGVT